MQASHGLWNRPPKVPVTAAATNSTHLGQLRCAHTSYKQSNARSSLQTWGKGQGYVEAARFGEGCALGAPPFLLFFRHRHLPQHLADKDLSPRSLLPERGTFLLEWSKTLSLTETSKFYKKHIAKGRLEARSAVLCHTVAREEHHHMLEKLKCKTTAARGKKIKKNKGTCSCLLVF